MLWQRTACCPSSAARTSRGSASERIHVSKSATISDSSARLVPAGGGTSAGGADAAAEGFAAEGLGALAAAVDLASALGVAAAPPPLASFFACASALLEASAGGVDRAFR